MPEYESDILKIDDLVNLYFEDMIASISLRIKIYPKSETNFMYIHINIFEEYIDGDTRIFSVNKRNFNEVISIEQSDDPENYKIIGYVRLICNNEESVCKSAFINTFNKIKPITLKISSSDDQILNNYLLEAIKADMETRMKIYYKFNSGKIEETQEYQDVSNDVFDCSRYCGSGNQCSFTPDNKNFFNVKCQCPDGYSGLKCSIKLSCINCAPGSCKLGNICDKCKIGWKGDKCQEKDIDSLVDLCNKNLKCKKNGKNTPKCICVKKGDKIDISIPGDQVITQTTHVQEALENVSKITGITNSKNETQEKTVTTQGNISKTSKASIAVGATIGSIFVIGAIIGIVIAVLK